MMYRSLFTDLNIEELNLHILNRTENNGKKERMWEISAK